MNVTPEEVKKTLLSFIQEETPLDIVERYAALPEIAAQADFGDLDSNIVVIDTETTGVSFKNDELTQIAAARIENGEISDWFITFVNPQRHIPDEISLLTGIYDSDVNDAPTAKEVLPKLVEFIGDAKLVAHNADFDRHFVSRHPQGASLKNNIWIDTLDITRIALPRLKSHRLIDLAHAFGTPESTHRADDDVATTAIVLRILLAAVQSMPNALILAIADLCDANEWNTQVVFDYFARTYRESLQSANEQPMLFERDEAEVKKKEFYFSLSSLRRKRIATEINKFTKKDARQIENSEPGLIYPSTEEIEQAFSAEGLMGILKDNYEVRDAQIEMADLVGDAYRVSENLVVEAGTGVGKSMAYLIPSVMLAKKNNISIGVATKTNSLLDQLAYSELPRLKDAWSKAYPSESPLSFVSLKGINHYPCLHKVDNLLAHGAKMVEVNDKIVSQAPSIAGLLSYVEQSVYDDLDSLKIDYRALPRYLMTVNSKECLKRKCPYYKKLCFAHGARSEAETADVVVTNHSLLFCNVRADGGLLPPIRHWIVDEAHDAETEARSAFTQSIKSRRLSYLAQRMSNRAQANNFYHRVDDKLAKTTEGTNGLAYALLNKASSRGDEFSEAVAVYTPKIKSLLSYGKGSRRAKYDQFDLWLNKEIRDEADFFELCEFALNVKNTAEQLIMANQNLVACLDSYKSAAVVQNDIAAATIELGEICDAIKLIFEEQPDSYVYEAHLSRAKDRLDDEINARLVNVGDKMNESFYEMTSSVIYTSATITVNNNFNAFVKAVGLNESEASHARLAMLDSSFDFDNNMIIYVVNDMPEPNDPRYLKSLQKLLIDLHIAQNGSTLTLFTNRSDMRKCFDVVYPELKKEELRLVCQKWGVSTKRLMDDFRTDESLSLFALKSFWQGFDAPGDTLKSVIIPKLPFSLPSDPLYCERSSRDSAAWAHYVLPQAIIETKQAAGRLIRKSDDTGVFILADSRILSKSYGKTLLNSLQSKNIQFASSAEISERLAMMSQLSN